MRVFVLQDVVLEAAFPRSAIHRMDDSDVRDNEHLMSKLKSGELYHDRWTWGITSGSRAEGLTLDNVWGHEDADRDWMVLLGGPLGVYMAGGQQPRGKSCLDFRAEGCPPAYCKLQISDLHGLKESTILYESWCDNTCIVESESMLWLDTHNTLRLLKDCFGLTRDDSISGPACQDSTLDFVNTLVCSDAHPELHNEFRSRTRGPWPSAAVINYLLQLPMMLVLVGHKLSPEFKLQARMSWSHLEYKLIKELPESVRQGYIACKYVTKRFLKIHRGVNKTGDGRSEIGSYHIKSVFLHFLEKQPPSLIKSPFNLFLDLLAHLDDCLQAGKLAHYFVAQCDLLETVGNDERDLARRVIKEISSASLSALLACPTHPQQIYGDVSPDHLVIAFQRVSDLPTCQQSQNDLSELLACVDERRRGRFREQRESDEGKGLWNRVSGRAELTGLVEAQKQIKHF